MENAIINGLSMSCSHDYQCDCRAYKALIVSAKPKTYRTLCRPYALPEIAIISADMTRTSGIDSIRRT